MTCMSAKPPLNLDDWLSLIDTCATAAGVMAGGCILPFIGFTSAPDLKLAILIAGTGKIDLEPETMAWVQAVTTPTHIQVFSTPT